MNEELTIHERAAERYLSAKKNFKSAAELYATYCNNLIVESDGEPNAENLEELRLVVDMIKNQIVSEFMKNNGYYYDTQHTYPKWVRED